VAHTHQVQIFGKFFVGWREEARTSKKLKSLITQFFKICIQRLRLTPQACMAFFNVSPVMAEVLHAVHYQGACQARCRATERWSFLLSCCCDRFCTVGVLH
jgi:hypothetical protein